MARFFLGFAFGFAIVTAQAQSAVADEWRNHRVEDDLRCPR
jgi:hypothetical protein